MINILDQKKIGVSFDFEFENLKSLNKSGGSSDCYEVIDNPNIIVMLRSRVKNNYTLSNFINKFRNLLGLSHDNQDITIENNLLDEVKRLNNGVNLLNLYLEEYFLDCNFMLKENPKTQNKTICRIQKRLPANYQSLDDENVLLSISKNPVARMNLKDLIEKIEFMIINSHIAVDILSLGNIAYDPENLKFYLFDADPLITHASKLDEFSADYVVDNRIDNLNFRTVTGKKIYDGMDVTFEHLKYLKSFVERIDR